MQLSGANKLMGGIVGDFDGHAHVFDTSLQMAEGRRYTPLADAPYLLYRNILQQIGLDGGLVVQPSFYGTNNMFLLNVLDTARRQADLIIRGVVVIDPETDAETIASLSRRGVVGMRLNLVGWAYDEFELSRWVKLFDLVNQAGWHVELHLEGWRLGEFLPQLMAHCDQVVVDHFGLPDAADPVGCPGQAAILKAPLGRLMVKVSGPYRVFVNHDGTSAARRCWPIFNRLLERLGPDHLLWGSDWPWTRFEDMHSFQDTLDWRDIWLSGVEEKAAAL
ncbi:MAG: amidohydrolase family protein [Pseudomonadota bacterium]